MHAKLLHKIARKAGGTDEVVTLSGYAIEVAAAMPSLRRAGRRALSQGEIN